MNDLQKFFEAAMHKVMQNRERYVEAWIAETGINPKDAVLMQQTKSGEISMWVRPKTQIEIDLEGQEQGIYEQQRKAIELWNERALEWGIERDRLLAELRLARKVIDASDHWLEHGSRENESNQDYANWLAYHAARKACADIDVR